ncbi:MAG: hypothetical protein Q7T51_04100 [Candidatus Moranbacteria bacterium]|nr:hypothetical protein [Candidatus Moranbacteria bacterium]
MNFKKLTITIAGDLKGKLQGNYALQTSLGMQSALKFSNGIILINLTPADSNLELFSDCKLFKSKAIRNDDLRKAFDACNRISVELSACNAGAICLRAKFFSSGKNSFFEITALFAIEDGRIIALA